MEKKEVLKAKVEREKLINEEKKTHFTAVMKEREETKKKVIEDKILVKDASVKEIKQQKIAIIEQKKDYDLHKRLVKKQGIE